MTDNSSKPGAGKAIAIAAVVLGLLHHDFWFWSSDTLVFGFMPIGLFYHALFSFAAGALWWCAVKFAWPAHIEEWADELDDYGGPADASTATSPGSQQETTR